MRDRPAVQIYRSGSVLVRRSDRITGRLPRSFGSAEGVPAGVSGPDAVGGSERPDLIGREGAGERESRGQTERGRVLLDLRQNGGLQSIVGQGSGELLV